MSRSHDTRIYVEGQMCRSNMADQSHHVIDKKYNKMFFFNLVEKEQQSIMNEKKFFSHKLISSLTLTLYASLQQNGG